MKKTILLLVLFSAFFVSKSWSQSKEYSSQIPKDLHIVAISGGVAAWTPLYKIELDANGNGIYSEMPRENRKTGLFIEKNKFRLKAPAMRFIYNTILESDFFTLEKEYIAKGVLDGSFAQLTIIENNKTHKVKTQNMAVERFDKIMISINIATPKGNKIIYNELLR